MKQDDSWQSSACILCSINCGIEVEVEDGALKRIRGDKQHPHSLGYLCQKAARLDYYQNHQGRLRHPLRRRPDGSFERISWKVAIREVAARLLAVKQRHGGHAIAYYGGGGQGNHLGGTYAASLRAALGTPYLYNPLAQEKTGDFWVNGRLFGRQSCHVTEGIHEADYVVIIGANPWQAHGFPRARVVMQEIAKDPKRTLVVIDPRRTKSAELADVHMQVRPGMDAYLMAAMLGVIVQEGLVDQGFIDARTTGYDVLREVFGAVDIADYAARSGIEVAVVQQVARGLAKAKRASTRHDLGLEHSLNSTLNTYLEKLLFLLTGHFGREGCNTLHTQFVPLIGHSREPDNGGAVTRVTGMRGIGKLFPPNILPAEIDCDHPDRVRAVIVDSGNPLQTGADTPAYRRAFDKLDLVVSIDVAHTETTAFADYVLPAHSQFEKCEATFFTLSFPTNYFHVRRPLLPSTGDTLPEPEIYRRLLVAMGELPERFPLLEQAAMMHMKRPTLGLFQKALAARLAAQPKLQKYLPVVLYATLGKALPEGMASAAVVWGASQFYAKRYPNQVRRAGIEGHRQALGEALFHRIIEADTAVAISTHRYEEMWELVRHDDQRVHLVIDELLAELNVLRDKPAHRDKEYPYVLAAGERRAYNANQIYRDPQWRKKDKDGALRMHPHDADELGLEDGARVRCESAHGAVEVTVKRDERMLPGALSLPHGYGMANPTADGTVDAATQKGPRLNELTSAGHCDAIAKTPFHKYVPVKIVALGG